MMLVVTKGERSYRVGEVLTALRTSLACWLARSLVAWAAEIYGLLVLVLILFICWVNGLTA